MPVFLSLTLPVLTAYSDCTLGEEDHLREAPQCCLVSGAGARGTWGQHHGQWLTLGCRVKQSHTTSGFTCGERPPKEQLAKTHQHFVKEMCPIRT